MLPGTASSHARTRLSSGPCVRMMSCSISRKNWECLHFSWSRRGKEATAIPLEWSPMSISWTRLWTRGNFVLRLAQVRDPDPSACSKATTDLAVELLRPLICLNVWNCSDFDASGSKRCRLVPAAAASLFDLIGFIQKHSCEPNGICKNGKCFVGLSLKKERNALI